MRAGFGTREIDPIEARRAGKAATAIADATAMTRSISAAQPALRRVVQNGAAFTPGNGEARAKTMSLRSSARCRWRRSIGHL
jgi:hypothetical protein